MPQYSKNTVEVRKWCRRCQRYTMHQVNSGWRGKCLECIEGIQQKLKFKDPQPKQLKFRFE